MESSYTLIVITFIIVTFAFYIYLVKNLFKELKKTENIETYRSIQRKDAVILRRSVVITIIANLLRTESLQINEAKKAAVYDFVKKFIYDETEKKKAFKLLNKLTTIKKSKKRSYFAFEHIDSEDLAQELSLIISDDEKKELLYQMIKIAVSDGDCSQVIGYNGTSETNLLYNIAVKSFKLPEKDIESLMTAYQKNKLEEWHQANVIHPESLFERESQEDKNSTKKTEKIHLSVVSNISRVFCFVNNLIIFMFIYIIHNISFGLILYGSVILCIILSFILMVYINPNQSEKFHLLLGVKAVCKLKKNLKYSIVLAFLFITTCVINHFVILYFWTDNYFLSENEQIKKYMIIEKHTEKVRRNHQERIVYYTQVQRMDDMYFLEWHFPEIKPSEKIIIDKIKSISDFCHSLNYDNKEIPKSFDIKKKCVYDEFSEGDTCLITFKSGVFGKIHDIDYSR